MRVQIVPIGTSKGIRIPKTILEQCQIKQSVTLETKGRAIIIKPIKKEPREGWEESFKKMCENKNDILLINDSLDLNLKDWVW